MSYWVRMDSLIERGKEMLRLKESLIYEVMSPYIFGDAGNALNYLQSYIAVEGIMEILKSNHIEIIYDAKELSSFKLKMETAKKIKDGMLSIEKLNTKQKKLITKLFGLDNGIVLSHTELSGASRWHESTDLLIHAERMIIEYLLDGSNGSIKEGCLQFIPDSLLD